MFEILRTCGILAKVIGNFVSKTVMFKAISAKKKNFLTEKILLLPLPSSFYQTGILTVVNQFQEWLSSSLGGATSRFLLPNPTFPFFTVYSGIFYLRPSSSKPSSLLSLPSRVLGCTLRQHHNEMARSIMGQMFYKKKRIQDCCCYCRITI